MNFLFEDRHNLRNFTSCEDINTSGIGRFGISPLLTAAQIHFTMIGGNSELNYYDHYEDINGYIIPSSVNHSPEDWTGYNPRVKSCFEYLNEKYISDLRANKAYLMLDQSLEGYQTPWLWDWFHKDCQQYGVSPTRIIYVTGNMIADEVYKKWADDNKVYTRIKVIPYAHFELDMAKTALDRVDTEEPLPSFSDHITYKTKNIDNIKTYACLNKRIRQQRVWFYNYLYESGLLDKGLVSMNNFDHHTYGWEGKELSQEQVIKISEKLPLIVHDKPNNEFDDNFYIRRFNDKIALDTYFTVISEAHCGDSDETMFLSEKTFKVIAVRHPFMIMGNKDSMAMMRKIGYETFDGFMDESYDTLPTHERLQYLIESIRKVDNIKDKLEWFKSMESVIEHNYNTLIGKLYKYPDAYLELKNYVTDNKKKMI